MGGKIKSIIKPSRENGNLQAIGIMIYGFCRNVHPETCFFCWILDRNQQSADFHIHAMMIQHWI